MAPKKFTAHNGEGEKVIRNILTRRNNELEKRKIDPRYKVPLFTASAILAITALFGVGNIAFKEAKNRENTTSTVEFSENEEQDKNNSEVDFNEEGIAQNESSIIDETIDNTIEETTDITDNSREENVQIDSNVTEVLTPGVVIEFENQSLGNYEYSDEFGGTWVTVSEGLAETPEKWCYAMHRETGNYGYVDATKFEKYSPYITKNDKVIYKSKFTNPFDSTIECETGSVVYIKDSQPIKDKNGNSLYKLLVQKEKNNGEHGYDYFVGYVDLTQVTKAEDKEFSLGLINKKTQMRSTPQVINIEPSNEEKLIGENCGVKYILDISTYTSYQMEDFIQTLKYFDEKGILGGVIMEIATTGKSGSYQIKSISENEELDQKWNQIDQKLGKNVINSQNSLGNYDIFKKYIEETMKICPIGFYAYTNALTADEVSAIANVVAETEKQLEKDIPGFKEANKLPFVVDVEQGDEKDREARTEAVAQTVKLLGHGTDYKYYWTLEKGEDGAKEGLNVIDNQYMLYTMPSFVAAKKELANRGSHITCIEDVRRKTSDYTLINFGALYAPEKTGEDVYSKEMETCFNPVGLLSKMNSNVFYTEPEYFSYYNVKEADIMQCIGNLNNDCFEKMKLQRQIIDVSVCTTDTYNEIIDGTFKEHTGEFLENLNEAIKENHAIYEYHKSQMDSIEPERKVHEGDELLDNSTFQKEEVSLENDNIKNTNTNENKSNEEFERD